jgi:hypothetical protein
VTLCCRFFFPFCSLLDAISCFAQRLLKLAVWLEPKGSFNFKSLLFYRVQNKVNSNIYSTYVLTTLSTAYIVRSEFDKFFLCWKQIIKTQNLSNCFLKFSWVNKDAYYWLYIVRVHLQKSTQQRQSLSKQSSQSYEYTFLRGAMEKPHAIRRVCSRTKFSWTNFSHTHAHRVADFLSDFLFIFLIGRGHGKAETEIACENKNLPKYNKGKSRQAVFVHARVEWYVYERQSKPQELTIMYGTRVRDIFHIFATINNRGEMIIWGGAIVSSCPASRAMTLMDLIISIMILNGPPGI